MLTLAQHNTSNLLKYPVKVNHTEEENRIVFNSVLLLISYLLKCLLVHAGGLDGVNLLIQVDIKGLRAQVSNFVGFCGQHATQFNHSGADK